MHNIHPNSIVALAEFQKSCKGKKLSEQHRKKLSEAHKGKKNPKLSENLKKFYKTNPHPTTGRKNTPEQTKAQSERLRENPIKFWKGKKFSDEHRKKLSEAKKGKSNHRLGVPSPQVCGSKNPAWKGGITCEIMKGRGDYRNKKWKMAVREKCGNCCTSCKATEKLVVHHIKCWKKFPELRFDINNGKLLCRKCHYQEHLIMRNKNV